MEPRLELIGAPALRVAAWPVDTLDAFTSPELLAQADRILSLRDAILARRRELTDALFRIVPSLDRHDRWAVLRLRRTLHSGTDMAPFGHSVMDRLRDYGELRDRILRDIDDRERLATAVSEFDQKWEDEDHRQRQHLRALADSDRFRNALSIGQRGVSDAWERARQNPDANSLRSRRLEETLWRLLARACTRPTPHGLWAGIAPLISGGGANKARFHVGVRLVDFCRAAEAIARVDPVAGLLQRDPSVHCDGDTWWWLGLGPDGPAWRQIASQPLLDSILGMFEAGHSVDAQQLIGSLAGGSASTRGRLGDLLRSLVARGLLQPGAALPGAPRDIWEALHSVTPRLPAPFAGVWARGVETLQTSCAELSAGLHLWAPEQVRAKLRACDAAVAELCAQACVPPPAPGVVTVDMEMGAEFRLDWTDRDRSVAAVAIAAGLAVHGGDGSAERYRRACVAELAASLQGRPPVSLGEAARRWDAFLTRGRIPAARPVVTDPFDTRAGLFDRRFGTRGVAALGMQFDCDTWEDRLASSWFQPTLTLAEPGLLPPYGHGAAILTADGRGGLAFMSARPQPGLFHSRHRSLAAATADLRAALSGVAVEVVGRDCPEPAVTVRPDLTGKQLDLSASGPTAADNWRVTADGDGRVWFIATSAPGRRFMPIYNSASALGRSDPLSHLLWIAALSHGWEWLSIGIPALPAERAVWHHHPEIRAPVGPGVQVAARRWTLPAAAVRAVAAASGPARFLAWRNAVRAMGLPDLVQVHGEDPEVPSKAAVVSSTVAVEALFQRVDPATAESMIITPVSPSADPQYRVTNRDGHEHVWEIAQPWRITGSPAEEPSTLEGVPIDAGTSRAVDIEASLARIEMRESCGRRWVQLDGELLGPEAWAALAVQITSLRRAGLISRWWFIHKPPGIRLRLETDEPAKLRHVLADQVGMGSSLRILTVGAYEPEVDRFGGASGLDLAHTHFAADSRIVLAWRTGEIADCEALAALVGLVTAQGIFSRIAEDRQEMRDLWLRLDNAFAPHAPESDESARVNSSAIRAVLAGDEPVIGDKTAAALLVRARRWAERTGDAAAELRRIEGIPVRAWAAAVVVFHWNRWALGAGVAAPLVKSLLAELGRG